jgi:hypothetical protein
VQRPVAFVAIGNEVTPWSVGPFSEDLMMSPARHRSETWQISGDPPSTVTYRTFSKSGGSTIDINKVDGLDTVKRFHVKDGGQ